MRRSQQDKAGAGVGRSKSTSQVSGIWQATSRPSYSPVDNMCTGPLATEGLPPWQRAAQGELTTPFADSLPSGGAS